MRIGQGISLLALTLALGTTACKKKAADTGAAGSGSDMGAGSSTGSAMTAGSGSADTMAGSGSGSGSAMAGSAEGSGSAAMAGSGSAGAGSAESAAMSHKAGMCPSTVAGATTTVAVKDGKVLVTVASTDKDAIAAIQKRTDELLKEKADNMGSAGKTSGEHDMKGTHGGGMGLCPVHVPEGGTATSKKDAKGVVVTITSKDPKGADALKADVETRITKIGEWMKSNVKEGDKGTTGGVGGGAGKHGMNHSGSGDAKGKDRKDGGGGGKGTGGGSGGGSGSGSGAKK